jgi:hypothetical protein
LQEVTGSVALFERVGEREGLPRFDFRTSRYGGLDVGEWFRFADVDQDGDLSATPKAGPSSPTGRIFPSSATWTATGARIC